MKNLFAVIAVVLACATLSAQTLFTETFATRRGSTNIDKVQLESSTAWPYANQWYTGYTGTEGAVEGNQYDNDYTAVESYGVSVRGKKLNGGDKNTVGLYFSSNKEEAKDYVKFTGALPEIPVGGAFLHFQICSSETDGGDLSTMIVKVNDQAVNVPATSLGKQYVTSVVTISLPAGQMNSLSFAFDNVPSQKFINRFWIDLDSDGFIKIGDLYYNLNSEDKTAEVTYELYLNDNNYKGLTTANIPASVTYSGTTYSVTSIGERAFYNCSSLTSVTIPNSVTSIGENAFEWCSNLTSVESPALLFNDAFSIFRLSELEMPSQIMHLTINAGTLTEEGFDRIRASYRNMESVDLANAENTELSDEAFKGCYNLQTLRLPAGLKEIKYMAVAECVKLQAIDIPVTVESIGDRAFEDCRSMATVTFAGNAIQSIGCWAFYNCHALQNIVIPEGVTIPMETASQIQQYLNSDWIIPKGEVTWNFSGRDGVFTVPDSTHYIIKYNALVLGAGEQDFANEAEMNGFSSLKEDSRTFEGGATAGATICQLKLLKHKDGMTSHGLQGAVFQLFRGTGIYDDQTGEEIKEPMKWGKSWSNESGSGNVGENITFTTDDNGYCMIALR